MNDDKVSELPNAAALKPMARKPKCLVFCFDGTWNKLATEYPTNVVLFSASIEREPADGTLQIIHYDEGVGTDPWEGFTGFLDWFKGGTAGYGLLANVREAYRFLMFNYDPGDEIFVFGFSRGAFSARTFVGFVRYVGVLRRLHVARIDEAIEQYKRRLPAEDGSSDDMRRFRSRYSSTTCVDAEDEVWRCKYDKDYTPGSGHLLTVRYLGVWDTVGALGWPSLILGSKKLNRKYQFHDISLTPFVQSARHAVATDERRVLFPPELWGDLSELNRAAGFEPDDEKAPYQEKWFPGDHGSVGGGGDIRGLSDRTLAWIAKGAKLAGLVLDREKGSRIHGFAPQAYAPLENVAKPPGFDVTRIKLADRHGPQFPWQISKALARRWHALAEALPDGHLYRPKALEKAAGLLNAYPLDQITNSELPVLTIHTVQSGDRLSGLAVQYYGAGQGKLWKEFLSANRRDLDEDDDLFLGQKLSIPKLDITPD